MVPIRGGLRSLSGMDSLASRICLPSVRGARILAYGSRPSSVPWMSALNFGQSWNGLREHAKAVAFMVSCHVADDGAKDGVEREEPMRHLWIWKLPNGMGMVAETQKRNDSQRSRPASRSR